MSRKDSDLSLWGPAATVLLLGFAPALLLLRGLAHGEDVDPGTLALLCICFAIACAVAVGLLGHRTARALRRAEQAEASAEAVIQSSNDLVNLTGDALWECDADFRLTSVRLPPTPNFRVGSLPEIGSDLRRWSPLVALTSRSPRAQAAVSAGEGFALPLKETLPDLSQRLLDLRAVPRATPTGVSGLRGIVRDAGPVPATKPQIPATPTEQEDRSRLTAYLNLGEGFFWEQDAELRFTTFLHSTRRPGAEFARQALGRTMPDLDLAHGQTHALRVFADQRAGQPFSDLTLGLKDRESGWHWFMLNGQAIVTPDGRMTGYRGKGRDITHQVLSERALVRSEERYQQLARVSPDAILIHRFGVVLYANPAALKLLGLTDPSQLVGSQLLDFIHAGSREGLIEDFVALASTDEPLHSQPTRLEVRMHNRGRQQIVAEITNSLIETESQPAILSVLRDITASRQIEIELRESHERYRLLFELSPDPIFVTRGGIFLIANTVSASVFGVGTPDKLVGTPLERFLHPDCREDAVARFASIEGPAEVRMSGQELAGSPSASLDSCLPTVLERSPAVGAAAIREVQSETLLRTVTMEQRCVTADGRVLTLEFHSARMDVNGRTALLSTVRDVTDRKRLEGELRSLNDHLETRVRERTAEVEASIRELESFSYTVSHDLRAPLRGIDGFAQILAEDYADGMDAGGRQYLDRIRRASRHMASLIDDLLDLSRVSRAPLNRVTVNVSALVTDMLAELRESDPERMTHFNVAGGIVADADPALLRVILDNLLRNAWKFSRRQPITRIDVEPLGSDGWHGFRVSDNGTGFDNAHASKLFRPFERLHSADDFEGTGIGLATVKRIVERHRGQVHAHGEPGVGASFDVLLPAPAVRAA